MRFHIKAKRLLRNLPFYTNLVYIFPEFHNFQHFLFEKSYKGTCDTYSSTCIIEINSSVTPSPIKKKKVSNVKSFRVPELGKQFSV